MATSTPAFAPVASQLPLPPGGGTLAAVRRSAGPWTEAVVHRFAGGSEDGGSAYNGMVANPKGIMFGATVHGGDDDDGAIYSFTP